MSSCVQPPYHTRMLVRVTRHRSAATWARAIRSIRPLPPSLRHMQTRLNEITPLSLPLLRKDACKLKSAYKGKSDAIKSDWFPNERELVSGIPTSSGTCCFNIDLSTFY